MKEKPKRQFVTNFIFDKLQDKIDLSEEEIIKIKDEAITLEIMELTELFLKTLRI